MKERNMGGIWAVLMHALILFALGAGGLLGVMGTLDEFGRNICLILLVVSLLLFAVVGFGIYKNKQNYRAFYALFPSLQGNLDSVLTDASFVSKKLGILVYKGYLVGYRVGGFKFVSLEETESLEYVWNKGSRRRMPEAFLKAGLASSNKSVSVQIAFLASKETQPLLDDLYSFIHSQYPHISFQ